MIDMPFVVRGCSWEARSVWRDLVDMASEGASRPLVTWPVESGLLTVTQVTKVARALGAQHHKLRKYLGELEGAGAILVAEDRISEGVA